MNFSQAKNGMGNKGAYRSLSVDVAVVDEENQTIECMGYTKEGVSSISATDAMAVNLAAELNNTANVTYGNTETVYEPIVISGGEGSWISVRDVEFAEGKLAFLGTVKGTGRIEVRLDTPDGEILTSIDFDTADEFKTIYNEAVESVSGTHDLYFVFSHENIEFKTWQFAERA